MRFDPEFDHVFEVHEDGRITDRDDLYAPTLYDDDLDSDQWEMLSGYTGQYAYHGPVMHNSEVFAGRLHDDVLSTPGVYVLVVAHWSPREDEDPNDYDDVEGWAVCRYRAGA